MNDFSVWLAGSVKMESQSEQEVKPDSFRGWLAPAEKLTCSARVAQDHSSREKNTI